MNKETTAQVFLYNENQVIFQMEGNEMINTTKLSKPFGAKKKPTFWLRTQAAQEYVEALSTELQICTSALIKVVRGGDSQQGTWMHPDIAIEYARWLNPRFGIWCNLRIQELLKNGYTITEEFKQEMSDKLQSLYSALERIQSNYEAVVVRNMELEAIIRKERESQKRLIPQKYQRTYTITSIARELGILPEELNDHLRRNWVQHKIDGFWVLKPEYQGQDYAITRYGVNGYYEVDGSYHEIPYQYLVWTSKGKELILEIYEMYE